MPPIEIQVLEGVFSNDEKRQIIERVSDAFALVAGQTINCRHLGSDAGNQKRLLG